MTHLRAKTGNFRGVYTPFCLDCKETNLSRYDCREIHRHQKLPWSTVYVVLSAAARVPDKQNQAHNSVLLDVDLKKGISGNEHPIQVKKTNESHTKEISTITSTVSESGKIQKIESRAFLMTIENDRSCELHVSADSFYCVYQCHSFVCLTINACSLYSYVSTVAGSM